MNVRRYFVDRIAEALRPYGPEAVAYADLVRPTQQSRFGDYQVNAAMPVARLLNRTASEVAKEIARHLSTSPLVDQVEVAGPGFVNIWLSDQWLGRYLRTLADDERLGVAKVAQPERFILDFSSPNVAKPMHVGHLRSTIIGDALQRMLRFVGHTTVSDNHLGDWGTQFGMIIYGFKHFRDEENWRRHPVRELARLYHLVHQMTKAAEWEEPLEQIRQLRQQGPEGARQAEEKLLELAEEAGLLDREEPARDRTAALQKIERLLEEKIQQARPIAEATRGETAKLHRGDPENRSLWEMFLPYCLEELRAIYKRLDVHFDYTLGESFYQPMLESVVQELLEKGIATVSEGAVCVFLSDDQPPCIIKKRDGAYTYATTDLATIKYRVENFNPHHILYVVDHRQSLHFRQLFDIARRWGYDRVDYQHVAFGTVLGADRRPFRTREGAAVGLQELLDEAVERARKVVNENSPHLPESVRQRIAEAVGLGALKYADLSQNRTTDYIFSWDKMLAMQGNTGTYLQYAYARIRSIFRKGDIDPAKARSGVDCALLSHVAERGLGVLLVRFPEVLEQTLRDYMPHYLTGYLYELAEGFSTFYNSCEVLRAESRALQASRIVLCDLTARTLQLGLQLLGIATVEQM
jgi:arginyl-tRNA synthetase